MSVFTGRLREGRMVESSSPRKKSYNSESTEGSQGSVGSYVCVACVCVYVALVRCEGGVAKKGRGKGGSSR